jgi:hypothetical protein
MCYHSRRSQADATQPGPAHLPPQKLDKCSLEHLLRLGQVVCPLGE